jgi:hypothetical protein
MIGKPRLDATRAAGRTGVTKRLHGQVDMACGPHPPLLIPDFEANLAIRYPDRLGAARRAAGQDGDRM